MGQRGHNPKSCGVGDGARTREPGFTKLPDAHGGGDVWGSCGQLWGKFAPQAPHKMMSLNNRGIDLGIGPAPGTDGSAEGRTRVHLRGTSGCFLELSCILDLVPEGCSVVAPTGPLSRSCVLSKHIGCRCLLSPWCPPGDVLLLSQTVTIRFGEFRLGSWRTSSGRSA